MHDDEKLRQQMASIGTRYLTRTLGELRRIGELLSQVEAGSPSALKELEQATHKIHGSGAMFGFHALSDLAGTIEDITALLGGGEGPDHLRALGQDELRSKLSATVAQLDQAVRAAAQAQGIDTNAG